MPPRIFHYTDEELEAGFAAIRDELDVPRSFPDDVLDQAERAAERGPQLPPGAGGTRIVDRTEIPFVAIDPPGSRDLDQAFAAEARPGGGWRVFYAIADVAAFVAVGSALDDEARERGVTLYSPDLRSSLHPEALNEDAASLLADVDRQVLLWTIDLDATGEIDHAHVERATVRNRRTMTYLEAQHEIDLGGADESLALLKPIGLARQELERQRGAVSLQLPAQEITKDANGYHLVYDRELPIEGWNAQISLLTGIAAARIMIDGGVGLLRTLPTPDEYTIHQIRSTALGLGISWPESMSYAERVRTIKPDTPPTAAFLSRAARGLRGAGYVAFANGDIPEHPEHSAIASVYAHVTAPLRRVSDRFTNEVVLALVSGREVPPWVLHALPDMPAIMGRSRSRDRSLERTVTDYVETMCMKDRVGDIFSAVVTGHGRDTSTLMITEPAVIASIAGKNHTLGARLNVRLTDANVERRRLTFSPV